MPHGTDTDAAVPAFPVDGGIVEAGDVSRGHDLSGAANGSISTPDSW